MKSENSEDELEDHVEEQEEVPTAEAVLSPAQAAPPVKEESRVRHFFRHLARWTLGVLIVLGIGFVAALLLFYMPLRRQAAAQTNELNAAQSRISQLESQLAEKSQLEKAYQESLQRLKQADLQNDMLNLQMEIATARIALYENKKDQAQIALQNASAILKAIQSRASASQRAALSEMETRLNLAMSGLEKDTFAAQSDLNVLARSLSEFSASLAGSTP